MLLRELRVDHVLHSGQRTRSNRLVVAHKVIDRRAKHKLHGVFVGFHRIFIQQIEILLPVEAIQPGDGRLARGSSRWNFSAP